MIPFMLEMGEYNMTFNELCADFSRRKPCGEMVWIAFVTLEWTHVSSSSNDLLRKYLHDHQIPYLNSYGRVWFLIDNQWTCTEVIYDRKTNLAHFSRCVPDNKTIK